jgi:hypothetical protein
VFVFLWVCIGGIDYRIMAFFTRDQRHLMCLEKNINSNRDQNWMVVDYKCSIEVVVLYSL